MQPPKSVTITPLNFIFQDERWLRKLGVLFAIGLIPGLNLIAWMGYMISTAHNVVRGATRPLPDWQDWADILARGLMSLSASLALFVPVFVLLAAGLALNAAGMGAALLCALLIVIFGVMLALALLAAGHIRYARTDRHQDYYDLGSRLGDLRRFAPMFGPLVIGQVLFAGGSLVVGALLSVTLVGPLVVFSVASAVNGYILGMAARQMRRAQPIARPAGGVPAR